MTGYECYKAYLGIRQHFSKAKFDFVAGHRIKFSEAKFDEKPERNFFHKLADEYPKGDLIRFLAVNHVAGFTHISQYSGSVFREWDHLMNSLEYKFDGDLKKMVDISEQAGVHFKDLFKSANGGLPLALQMVNGKHITLETFCVIDAVLSGNIIKQMDIQVTDMFVYPALRMKIVKYQPFIVYNREIMLDILRKYI